MDLPRLIAHRGAPRLAPENTLVGLTLARAQGATWTEFDVTLSADDVAVVFHDDNLERTTDGHGPIEKQSLAHLKELSAGAWFSPDYLDCRIPTLAEYLETAASLRLGINVELKPIDRARCQTLCHEVLHTLAQLWPNDLPAPLLSSFSAENLHMLRELNCPYPLALNTSRWSEAQLSLAQQLGCYSLHCKASLLTATQVATNTAVGMHTLAYTVNETYLAQQLFDWGVTAVFSDIPDLIR